MGCFKAIWNQLNLLFPAVSMNFGQELQKLNLLASEIESPSFPWRVQCFFGASISQPHKLLLSSSLLGKGRSFPQPSHILHECCGCVKRIPGCLFSRYAEQRAPYCASHERPHWLQKSLSDDPRAAKSSSLTRQELQSTACSMCKLLLQRRRAFHTAEAGTQAQSRSRTCPAPAASLPAVQITPVLRSTHIHPHVHSHTAHTRSLQQDLPWFCNTLNADLYIIVFSYGLEKRKYILLHKLRGQDVCSITGWPCHKEIRRGVCPWGHRGPQALQGAAGRRRWVLFLPHSSWGPGGRGNDNPLTPSPLRVANQGSTSTDRRAIIVLLWAFPGKSELLSDLLWARRVGTQASPCSLFIVSSGWVISSPWKQRGLDSIS